MNEMNRQLKYIIRSAFLKIELTLQSIDRQILSMENIRAHEFDVPVLLVLAILNNTELIEELFLMIYSINIYCTQHTV